MIEYANESVIKLLKQYDMFSKSLNYTDDIKQKNDICTEMTRLIQNVLDITNSIYEEKYKTVENRSVYLMSEERTRLLELVNLINERKAYVNNQITSNKELTGVGIEVKPILGEDKLESYKQQVKIIERYKNNIKLESVLKDEIKTLDANIKKANEKINSNQNLNRQLEEKMIVILDNALRKLSLGELKERQKEIDLAYTELGYSLEKAKENALIARKECSEEIILECDNMLASITLEYERYKEKKLILNLINIYKNPVNDYNKMLSKREEINNILMNITSSELYHLVGNELNKEYATIKLEQQDMSTLKSLVEEKNLKESNLEDIIAENNSEELKGLLANLLENEKKYQEKVMEEKQKKEQERLKQERIEEERRQKEIAKRQQVLEEERKKEIERRTKQLLVEKKNPVLNKSRESIREEKELSSKKEIPSPSVKESREKITQQRSLNEKNSTRENSIPSQTRRINSSPSKSLEKEDFFIQPKTRTSVVKEGIPVIKNKNLENEVVTAKRVDDNQFNNKVFPDISLEKKENIFPSFPEINKSNSFFDEEEFKDLSNYMEEDKKKNWF